MKRNQRLKARKKRLGSVRSNTTGPSTMVHDRKLLRSIAKTQLEMRGIQNLNKPLKAPGESAFKSKFARLWRNDKLVRVDTKPMKRIGKKGHSTLFFA